MCGRDGWMTETKKGEVKIKKKRDEFAVSDLVYFLYRIIRVYIIVITYSLISSARMSTQRVS